LLLNPSILLYEIHSLLLIFACTQKTPTKTIEKIITDNFTPQMDDPESFEFVGIDFIDTITVAQAIEEEIKGEQMVLDARFEGRESLKELIETIKEGILVSKYHDYKTELVEAEQRLTKINAEIASDEKGIDSLKQLM
jgi:hypothetical protein